MTGNYRRLLVNVVTSSSATQKYFGGFSSIFEIDVDWYIKLHTTTEKGTMNRVRQRQLENYFRYVTDKFSLINYSMEVI